MIDTTSKQQKDIEQVASQPANKPKTVVAVIISVVITAIMVGGIMYIVERERQTNKILSLQKEIEICDQEITEEALQAESVVRNKYKVYKSNFEQFEVPDNWSIYKCPECIGIDELSKSPAISVARDEVTHNDSNRTQVDFYYTVNDIVDELIKETKNYPEYTYTTETIGGVSAQVVNLPLNEDGSTTKFNSGGKTYFIKLPASHEYKTLVIKKQFLGDDDFESDFDHLIESIQF